MIFIDRINELKALNDRYDSGKAEFVVVYGRRRVGKTELLKQFMNNHDGIIFTTHEESEKLQLNRFSKRLSDFFDDYVLSKNSLNNFDSLFEYLYTKSLNKRVIFAIDEFPYLVKNNSSLLSILQDYWDNKLKYTKIFFIISGSNMSMMENMMIYKSPIYGRRTGQLLIKPIEFTPLINYFGDAKLAVEYYSIYGGTPAYINEINKTKNLIENVRNNFLSLDSFINQDVMFLLREEFDEPRYYFSIFEAIANGNVTLAEIIEYTGLERALLSKYIRILIDLDFIKRDIPVTASNKVKKGIYKFKDNMIAFYFRFIYNNYDLIEMNKTGELLQVINNDLNTLYNDFIHNSIMAMIREYCEFFVGQSTVYSMYIPFHIQV